MKRFTLAIALSAASLFAAAQEGNNICVFNSLQTYDGGKGDPQDLVRALKCSDEAIVDATTSVKSKTWFYRGKLYTLISLDKTLKPQYPNAIFESISAFKKLYEVNDPKFKDWSEVGDYLTPVSNNAALLASEKYQSKEFAESYKFFYAIKDANTVLAAKNLKINVSTAAALKNAAIAAENGGDNGTAYKTMVELYNMQPDTLGNIKYVIQLAKKTNQNDKYKMYLEEGLKKYPKDAFLLTQKVNDYLVNNDYQGALVFINNLLQADPLNYDALNVKGQAYQDSWKEVTKQIDSLGSTPADMKKAAELGAKANMFADSMAAAYNQALSINAKSVTAWTNMGAFYVDKANIYIAKMNKLGNSAEDMKKYDVLKKERKDIYLKAKEYLTKAKELDPDNAELARTLKKIELYVAE